MKKKLFFTFYGNRACLPFETVKEMLEVTSDRNNAKFLKLEIDLNDLDYISDVYPEKSKLSRIDELKKELEELENDDPTNPTL
jgi:hypothetical protein